jgi:two-component system OmpR family response regulator
MSLAPAPVPRLAWTDLMNILIVEDDLEGGQYLKRALERAGHVAEHATGGAQGLRLASSETYDVIVLDRLLPELDGLSLLGTIRALGVKTPVLLLTALDSIDDRVRGLTSGADDYLVKPYALAELMARIHVLSRRLQPHEVQTLMTIGDLRIDLLSRKVTRGGVVIDLKPKEFQVLEYLARHAGRVVTRSMLLEGVWGFHFDPNTNIVETHLSRIRAKLERDTWPALIHTIRGAGYCLREPG